MSEAQDNTFKVSPSLEGTFQKVEELGKKAKQPLLRLPERAYQFQIDAFSQDRPEREPAIYEGREVYKFEDKGNNHHLIEYIPKDAVPEGIPSHSAMHKVLNRALMVGLENRSPAFYLEGFDFLAGMGVDEETLKTQGRPYIELKYVLSVMTKMSLDYKRWDETETKKILVEISGSPLTYKRVTITDKKTGKSFEKDHIIINEHYTEGMNFETGEVATRFISVPVDVLWGKSSGFYEDTLRFRLCNYVGQRNTTIKGETLLNLTGASAKIRKRKQAREKMRDLIFQVLDNMLFEYVIDDKEGKLKDFRKWIIYLTPPSKDGKPRQAIDKTALVFIDKYVEWACRPVHYGKKGQTQPEDVTRKQITNAVRRHGLEFVENVFNRTQKEHTPHPKTFWAKYRQAVQDKEKTEKNSTRTPEIAQADIQKRQVKDLVQGLIPETEILPQVRTAPKETEEERQDRVNRKKQELREQAERLKKG